MGERINEFHILGHSKSFFTIFATLVFLFFILCTPLQALAASLSLSPSTGNFKAGQNFSVSIYVSSANQAMNAAQGTLAFPSDKLQVLSVSKAGSILNLWIQDPTFSNSAGTVNFEGIVYNPGFTGPTGKIITINFRAVANGTASLKFSSGSVLANDGQGTNIVSSLGSAKYTVVVDGETTTPTDDSSTIDEIKNPPTKPVITSPTHPDQDRWYSDNNPTFEWKRPRDITGVSFIIDQELLTVPDTQSEGQLESYTSQTLQDGEWFFHIRMKNAAGWSEVTHYRVQIDTKNPTYLDITEIEDTDPGIAKFIFSSDDVLSHIDKYEVRIDNTIVDIWRDSGAHVYTTPMLPGGIHSLSVKAIDFAGNFLTDSLEFDVVPSIAEIPEERMTFGTLFEKYELLFLCFIGIPSILFSILLILLIANMFNRFVIGRKRVENSGKEVAHMEQELNQTLNTLHDGVEEFKIMIEKSRLKRRLAEEEMDIAEINMLGRLEDDIENAEKNLKHPNHDKPEKKDI